MLWRHVWRQLVEATAQGGLSKARSVGAIWASWERWASTAADRETTSSNLSASDGSIQRTYKTVDVQPHPEKSGFRILLDRRVLRTPNNSELTLPTHALALAIGAEWEWQSERRVHPSTMPLMTLAATAIDQPKPRVFMVEEMESYIFTDPVLSRDPESKLRHLQNQIFYPIQSWAESYLTTRFKVSDSIDGTDQSKATVERVRHYLGSFDRWKLICLHSMVLDSKSLLIGAALFNGALSVRGAVLASRLEEDSQIQEWGAVEGGHDIDQSVLSMKLRAASVFLKLLKA